MLVGYVWQETTKTGTLQVTFSSETCEIPYNEEELQDLALETYALRPCLLRVATDIMSAEMRLIHNSAHGYFNEVGRPARRSLATILKQVGLQPVDESAVVPVYNVGETRVVYLQIEHILNFGFDNVGKRRPPWSVKVPNSLYAEFPVMGVDGSSQPTVRSSGKRRPEQLFDSDDDLLVDDEGDKAPPPNSEKAFPRR
ncbi:hypothetical protein GN958_ATG08052 [Phytophthora infestans]|uniref:Uncharacterized protein n=1 Tax=Phytophthora infestans TaxID=4787 RepID=A0A8S9U3X7_PHYIN|nr:hypothetical protein GN958_ATG15195 [Phytophthora infestans]KAF4142740.1 hypothetical protein GN958_ATG08052 [Phytophthora infestans]